MPITFRGNVANRGGPAFAVASDRYDYFELGERKGDGHWLEASVIDGEFNFNGRIFLPASSGEQASGTIIDNFPKGPAPSGWEQHRQVDRQGYKLISKNGKVLFGYVVDGAVCRVTVNIYAADGGLVAESGDTDLIIHRGPAMLGRGGIRIE